jgi:hypothetical protein
MQVSDEFAAALKELTGFEQSSIAQFADSHHLPVVRKRYRDAILSKAMRLESGAK